MSRSASALGVTLAVALLAALACHTAAAETIGVGGTTRTYLLQRPVSPEPAPLVIVLHGNTQQGADIAARSGWPGVAAARGFALALPDGLDRAWADARAPDERAGRVPTAGTDDLAFLDALIDRLVADRVADPRRIYLAGVSNGGAMTLTYACRRPQRIAAAASVIMAMTRTMADGCAPAVPVPVLLMNGTADPLVAWDGGRAPSRYAIANLLSSVDTMRAWRRIDGCAPDDIAPVALPDTVPDDGSTVVVHGSRCPAGVDVVLYRIEGGGHRAPGHEPDARSPTIVDRLLGRQNRDVDAAVEIWRFFERFARQR